MQRRLRLISLSNYVFVLEISRISGIVQNARMFIRVVRRNEDGCCGHFTVGHASRINLFKFLIS